MVEKQQGNKDYSEKNKVKKTEIVSPANRAKEILARRRRFGRIRMLSGL